jgi:hypothetical protein
MRQKLGEKKTQKLRDKLKLPIHHALVRGNTHHRIDLFLDDGRMLYLEKDGELEECEGNWKEV